MPSTGGCAVAEFTALVLLCGVATYAWRGLGVALARRVNVDGELFRWVSCVAFAMIAGLMARIILLPTGALASTGVAERLAATACALVVYFLLTRRNLFAGVSAGALAIVALEAVLKG
jgi:branched-subunit amino acid transport protein